ncbi:MAG TPA: hydroxyacid dehydrogenase, partial [Actinoplanes sp.]
MTHRPPAMFAMSPEHLPMLFPAPLLERIAQFVDIDADLAVERFDDPRAAGLIAGLEVLITGWGSPRLDETFLAAAPRLRAVLHTAGSVKSLVTPHTWAHGVTVCSAAEANAVPVAEFTVGMVLLAGKGAFELRERYRRARGFTVSEVAPHVGNYGRRVGVIGASRVGRQVLNQLRRYDFDLRLHDPYADAPPVPNVPLA